MKIIVFKNEDGTCGVITPALKALEKMTLEDIANRDVPKGLEWRICDSEKLPSSRNWRGAWTDNNDTETVDVDLSVAKEAHKTLIISKANERIEKDLFGGQDFSKVKEELEAIDFDSITDLETLYNTFPKSINTRAGSREYKQHNKKK